MSAAAVASSSALPARLRIGRKKPHWLLAHAPDAETDDPLAALRRWLTQLSDSQVSLLAVSEFDSEFRRSLELRRQSGRPATTAGVADYHRGSSRRFARFLERDSTEWTGVNSDFEAENFDSVSDSGPAPPMPSWTSAPAPAPVPDDSDHASKSRALSTLQAVTGVGDSKRSLVARRFCDSAWPRTTADFARPRSVAYGQNLRLHPDLAGAIRAGILLDRPAFECVTVGGLAELDRQRPSLAKTKHDRVVDWLEEAC